MLEAMQRKFTKKLPGLFSMPYKDRLAITSLGRLELSHLRPDLIFTYKILFDYRCQLKRIFMPASDHYSTRGHAYKLFLHANQVDLRKHFISERLVLPWNNLPVEPTHFSSFVTFKKFVCTVGLAQYLLVYH